MWFDVCGGEFHSPSGYIRSPGWPASYTNSKTCTWRISVQTGRQIELNFLTFSLEDSTDCRFDKLEVHNGGLSTSPIVGTFCGSDFSKTLRSYSNQMYIVFVSDSSRNDVGFEIEWTSTATGCGGVLTSYRGSVTSPNFPEPYSENALCNWRIAVNSGSTIQIIFMDLDLETSSNCAYDYVEIFDGKDAGAKSLGRYCDSEKHPLQIVTTSNFAFARFASDSSNQGRGFSIKYTSMCNITIVDKLNGIVESPNFPEGYPHNMNCEWTIQGFSGNQINVEFTHFDLESSEMASSEGKCLFDYVEIVQYKMNDTIKSDKYCDSKPQAFTSVSNTVLIRFVTDINGRGNGWRLEWSLEGCGGRLNKPEGSLQSPNYPKPYPHGIECLWVITGEYGNTIELIIYDLDAEFSSECRFDGVEIRSEDEKIATICNFEKNPKRIVGHGHEMTVRFYSDTSYNFRGFNASYRSIPKKCGGFLTAASATIMSPNYPKIYDKNETCEWQITIDPSHRIQFNLMDFDVEPSENCEKDVLYVFDGPVESADKILLKHCGNSLPNNTSFYSTSNQMLVVFKADSEMEFKGFKANYSTACGSRIIAEGSGTIQLSDTIRYFNPNCTWTIVAQDLTKHVTLTVSHITTLFIPNEEDDNCTIAIKVFEGENINGPERSVICQGKAPPAIVSKGNALTISTFFKGSHYFGTESLLGLDILAHYSVLDNACGGVLNSFQGQIASPNYPLSYPLNVECVWTINVAPSNKLVLSFERIDIQSSDNCADDYLEIRDGSGSGKLLGLYCGTNPDRNITTASGSIWMKFKSSNEGAATGFLAEYSYATHTDIVQSEGQIASPLYPKTFLGSYTLTYRITVPYGYHVLITFDEFRFISFHPDENGDCLSTLKIFDGFDENSPNLSKGNCELDMPDPIRSTSNVVFVSATQFSHDFYPGRLFKLSYKAVEPSEVKLPSTDGCGDVQIALNVSTIFNISSPGYPYGYGHGLDCNWTITSIDPNFHPVFYVVEVDLEDTTSCVADYLEISTSKDLAVWQPAARLCNSNFSPFNIRPYEGTPHLKINFHSDYFNNRTGFSAMTTLYCGGELTGPNGVIQMLNYKEPPGHVGYCQYNITVRPGRVIEFEFEQFSFPKVRDTCDSHMTFRNGRDSESPLLGEGKYCGTEIPIIPRTSSRYAMVKLMNNLISSVQFKLKYREVGTECGGSVVLTQSYQSEIITSPNYPNIPNPFTECVFTFIAPAGESISINFLEKFDLSLVMDCSREYVELRDGGTERSQILGTYCGYTIPAPQTTTSNMLRVKFFTEVNDPKNGFKANVSIATCGGLYQGMTGYIKSPGYGTPGAYPANSVCEYRIRTKPQSIITLNMIDVDLPNTCSLDHIEVYSVIPNSLYRLNDTLIKHGDYCGDHTDSNIVSNSNEMLIVFKTLAPSTVYKGFKIKYNATMSPCGADITADQGTITSPGYPLSMRMNQICEWKITVPKGRRVVADVVDLDLAVNPQAFSSSRLIFYNGLKSYSRITTLTPSDGPTVVRSSDNTMLIMAWGRSVTMNRGFKINFSSDEATICEGSLDDVAGTIFAPSNITTYVCEYTVTRPLLGTILMEFSNVKAGLRPNSRCAFSGSKVVVRWPDSPRKDESNIAAMCGTEIPDTKVISPFPNIVVEARRSTYSGPVNFTLNYRVNRCGGMLRGSQFITNPKENPSSGSSGTIACAWYIRQNEGITMNIGVHEMNMTLDCDQEYLQLYNGPTAASPHFARYCGKSLPTDSINTQSNYLFVEYVSQSYNSGTKFQVYIVPSAAACGGIIHKPINTIKSPGNGTYYNNMECVWEIRADVGFGIDLWFKDRFYLEDSVNCTKDYVEVSVLKGDSYVTEGRYCGRHMPPALNTTSNRVRVKIVTDADIKGDGFTLEWTEHCGGVYLVQTQKHEMVSPNYPRNYAPNLKCNYTFYVTDPDAYINLNFNHFNLEDVKGRCRYDNVTIYREKDYLYGTDVWERVGTYCRSDSPGSLRFKKQISVIFTTDQWHERSGFQFDYFLDSCGGDIRSPQSIVPPKQQGTNTILSNSKCIWRLYAPSGTNIVVRFQNISLESSHGCWYDQISVFSSDNINNTASRKAKLCGNFTNTAIDLESNVGAIQFTNDAGRNDGHFLATILFMPSCSISRNITAHSAPYTVSVDANHYVANMDCHYKFFTDPGFIFSIKFNQFHVAPCSHNGSACTCDYLEIRDGAGPFGSLIGTYCGHEKPQELVTSGSSVWIRFVTDSVNMSSGFSLTLTREESVCGPPILKVGNTTSLKLEPPSRGGLYLKNLRCHWTIERDSLQLYGFFYIQFEFIDIQEPNSNHDCVDFLKITDNTVSDYISEGLGENIISRGHGVYSSYLSFFSGAHSPLQPHTYCGNNIPTAYYSNSDKLLVHFITDGETEARGFKLDISTVSSCRNYTSLTGRVHNNKPETCTFYISVPINYTIAIFFQNVYFFENDCSKSGVRIFDGSSVNSSASICSYSTPNPFFSTSNVVRLEVKGDAALTHSVGNIDFTYLATDKGRGCGGQMFNYGGTFTSPLYPENAREEADCLWQIAVPNNVKVALRFSVFDLGSKTTCPDNFVQILELNDEGKEQVVRQYCGEDTPSIYRSQNSVIAVRFKKTVNFSGTGFMANFIGAHEDSGIYEW